MEDKLVKKKAVRPYGRGFPAKAIASEYVFVPAGEVVDLPGFERSFEDRWIFVKEHDIQQEIDDAGIGLTLADIVARNDPDELASVSASALPDSSFSDQALPDAAPPADRSAADAPSEPVPVIKAAAPAPAAQTAGDNGREEASAAASPSADQLSTADLLKLLGSRLGEDKQR